MKKLTLKKNVEKVLTAIVILFIMFLALTIDSIADSLAYTIILIVGFIIAGGAMYLLVHFGKDFD